MKQEILSIKVLKLNSASAATSNQRGVILLTRTLLTFIVLISISYVMQSEIHYLPCDSTAKGYYYSYVGLTNHIPELESTMPLDIMVGYIVADSIIRNANNVQIYNFIKDLGNYDNDTLMYIIKYMYRLADYDPIRYRRYIGTCLNVSQKRCSGMSVENDVLKRLGIQKGDKRRGLLISPDYILHVRVNETVLTDIPDGIICTSLIAGHSTVLDRIKGQILPPLGAYYGIEINNSAIFESSYPNPTNFVFEYCPNWPGTSRGVIECEDGSPWLKPDKEYIIFTRLGGHCGTTMIAEENPSLNITPNIVYAAMYPILGNGSGGMFPIEDGNVIDARDFFGWGKVVPLAVFKQNLRNLIDTIRNFGE